MRRAHPTALCIEQNPGQQVWLIAGLSIGLIDAVLAEEQPRRLDDYYAALAALDPILTERAVSRLATKPTDRIAALIPRFNSERFLYDYLDDDKLLTRLNHVMRRVNLPQLPVTLVELISSMRRRVRQQMSDLLTPLET